MHLFAPQPGQFVLDIGAHDGSYAETFARAVGPSGAVWAVEPHPDSAELARVRLQPYAHATVIEAAVTEPGRASVTLMADVGDLRRSSLWPANLIGSLEAVDVCAVTVDGLLGTAAELSGRAGDGPMRWPDWIKVDAQGAERQILSGAAQTLDAGLSRWCLELWPMGLTNAGTNYQAVLDVFKARGYTAHTTGHDGYPVWDWADLEATCAREQRHSSIDAIFCPPGVTC